MANTQPSTRICRPCRGCPSRASLLANSRQSSGFHCLLQPVSTDPGGPTRRKAVAIVTPFRGRQRAGRRGKWTWSERLWCLPECDRPSPRWQSRGVGPQSTSCCQFTTLGRGRRVSRQAANSCTTTPDADLRLLVDTLVRSPAKPIRHVEAEESPSLLDEPECGRVPSGA